MRNLSKAVCVHMDHVLSGKPNPNYCVHSGFCILLRRLSYTRTDRSVGRMFSPLKLSKCVFAVKSRLTDEID
jgi:hypothetical protein